MKDLIFCSENDHADVVNMKKELPTIIKLLSKIKNRHSDLETSDVNTRRRVKTRRRLFWKTGSDCCIDQDSFSISNNGNKQITEVSARQAKNGATKDIIESVLKINIHNKKFDLHCALTNPRLIIESFNCGNFRKDDKRIHAALKSLNNQNMILKVASKSSTKRGRITDNKNSYVMAKFISISGTLTSSISNHIKHNELPKTTEYRLFNKDDTKRKNVFEYVDEIKWSSDKKE